MAERCAPVSPRRPAAICIYRSSKSTAREATVEIASPGDLREFFGREPLYRRRKTAVPLFSRARVRATSSRLKTDLVAPFLVLLDVDEAPISLREASLRLGDLGVSHVGYATWSHREKYRQSGLHSYRIVTDLGASSWHALEISTKRLFEALGIEEGRGADASSWKLPCFFVPAEREGEGPPEFVSLAAEPSTWRPGEIPPAPERPDGGEVRGGEPGPSDVDPDELRDALKAVENDDYETWVRVGMALHSSGLEEARDLWDEWSERDYPAYSDDAQAEKWQSFGGRRRGAVVGPASIFRLALDAGWKSKKRRTPADRLEHARRDFADVLDDEFERREADEVARKELRGIPPRTHAWNAKKLALEYSHELRYVESLKAWIHYDGRRWLPDRGLAATRAAKRSARRIFAEAQKDADLRWAATSSMSNCVRGTLDLAQPELAISSRRLDSDPYLLNVANGTLDLRTGELRSHDPADLLTKIAPTPYVEGARCRRWERFLAEVLPDEAARAFFQRLCGYALQGLQEAKVFAIVHGPGDGGKTTALEAIARTLGSAKLAPDEGGGGEAADGDDDDSAAVTRHYAETTPISTFAATSGGGNRPELAKLIGARLVIVNEIRGEALESSVMKTWTGGEPITATPKYAHPLRFYPDGTVFLVGNELPRLDWRDDAMWRRVVLVPFDCVVPEDEQIPNLVRRFDRRGVLSWAVEGHRAYREDGLRPPEALRARKADIRERSDPLAEFWEECVEVAPTGRERPSRRALADGWRVSTRDLFRAYETWTLATGVKSLDRLSQSGLTRAVVKREELERAANRAGGDCGFAAKKLGSWRGFEGLRIRSNDGDDNGEGGASR